MKNIVLLIITCVGLVSCDGLLDLKPENSVTFKNAFESEQDIESALKGTERLLRSITLYGGTTSPADRGIFSDNLRSGSGLLRDFGMGLYVGDWTKYYDLIMSANVTLPFLDKVEMAEIRRDFYRGEIAFFKAFAYLHIIRNYGDCVLVKDEVELKPLGQTPWPIVADYAIQLAKEAVRLLPEWNELRDASGNAVTHRGRPCRGAANAVLAHLCAWKAGGKYLTRPENRNYDEQELWRQVDTACTAIISRSDIYVLASTPEEVCTKVLSGGSQESIFESVFKGYWNEFSEFEKGCGTTFFAQRYIGYPVDPNAVPGSIKWKGAKILNTTVEEMFQEYVKEGNRFVDQRRYAWFYDYDRMAAMDVAITGGYAYPYKWRNPVLESVYGMFQGFDCNLIWWRLADIYLLRAESLVHLGDNNGAIADLNIIRDRAGAKRYEESEHGGDLRYTIFKEREKELLMEGSRWYDVVRNGYYRTELKGDHRILTEEDILNGALFAALPEIYFSENTLLRQGYFWIQRGEKN